MTATAFDTLSAAQDLEAAGIERKHAEAIAKVVNHGDERAATKADLDTATTALEARMTNIEARMTTLEASMTTLEARVTATLYRALWIQGGAIIAILTALRFLPI